MAIKKYNPRCSMKTHKIALIIILYAGTVLPAAPQERSKFIFGIGAGGGLAVVPYKGEDYSSPWGVRTYTDVYLQPCFSTNFRIGFAPSDRFYICWNSRPNWFTRPVVNEYDEYSEKSTLMGGLAGLSATFYPFRSAEKFFINTLFGYSNLGDAFKATGNHFGTGIGLGVGYEIKRYFTAELNAAISTSEKYYFGGDFRNPVQVNITLNYLTF